MLNLPQIIAEILRDAQRPAILCSFGSDSTLLLHFARQVKRDVPVYYFGDELPALAQQLVIDDDLTIYSYAPADRYLVPQGDSVALIEEYSLNGTRVPMISPVTSAPRGTCTHGSGVLRSPSFYFPHDIVLWGYKRTDRHKLVPTVFEREIQLGHTKFVAPLYDLTDEQVKDALIALDLDYVSEDSQKFCDDCLNAVLNSEWDRDAALAGFNSRFSYSH
jgi:hypothetical protein